MNADPDERECRRVRSLMVDESGPWDEIGREGWNMREHLRAYFRKKDAAGAIRSQRSSGAKRKRNRDALKKACS